MPRQRMAPGEHGRISERSSRGKYFATTYVRDPDGNRRRVERSSDKSAEDARRQLQRHLAARRAPVSGQLITDTTTLSELFELWITTKRTADGVSEQTTGQYRQVWAKHGARQLGALRVGEMPTSRAHAHLQTMGATTQAARLRTVLRGMFSMAARFDVIAVNPIVEARAVKTTKKPTRALTAAEFVAVRAAVAAYTAGDRHRGGPKPGRLLPAFIEVMAAVGQRPSEVLGIRWSDVDLLADPPIVRINGQVIDHNRIPGKPLHRADYRKGNAPEHTVVLPKFGVAALTALQNQAEPTNPVFANRNGGWMSLANVRRALREALPHELSWVTPHSFRRTVATVVREEHGPDAARQQLSHTKLATTEAHYLERQTTGPDVRTTLDKFAGRQSDK